MNALTTFNVRVIVYFSIDDHRARVDFSDAHGRPYNLHRTQFPRLVVTSVERSVVYIGVLRHECQGGLIFK